MNGQSEEKERRQFTEEEALLELKRRHAALSGRKKDLELEMSSLTARVKGKGLLPRHEYNEICEQQQKTRSMLIDTDRQLSDLKSEIREANLEIQGRREPWTDDERRRRDDVVAGIKRVIYWCEISASRAPHPALRKMAEDVIYQLEDIGYENY